MRTAFALICLALPAHAQEGPATFSLPAGCDAYLTVQSENCEVEHHFTCSADPTGHQRRVSLDEQGMNYLGMIDAEAQWVDSYYPLSNFREVLQPSPSDPASFSELMATKADQFDFFTFAEGYGATRYVGQDTLTGRTVEIDGVTLEETAYSIVAYGSAGQELYSAQGNEFISRDWRMFLSGTGAVTNETGTFEQSKRPVEFIFPGEVGFLSSRPKHGCGVALS